MQHARRHNPYPWTWEVPLAITCTVLLALVIGVQLGRGIANLTAGAGWCWPTRDWLVRSIPAILAGDATAGIHTTTRFADRAGLRGWLVVTETAILVLLTAVGVVVVRRWGPHRLMGMASPSEAEKLLGVSRLRRVRHVIRPDLHPTPTAMIGGRR